jgi:SAM-dependent methyltransferase
MIPNPEYNIWEHSATVRALYAARARGEQEMDASRQAVDILTPFIRPGMTVLDAGCGSGYLYWSFARRGLAVEYHGLDYSPTLIGIGRDILPQAAGLPMERLRIGAIENLSDPHDVVVCLNTLSWCPDFRLTLDRLASAARQYLVIRDNLGPETVVRWEEDGYLDDGYNHLKAYWNQYSERDMTAFLDDMGFDVDPIVDQRTGGAVEMVVGKPYFWKFLLARRRSS